MVNVKAIEQREQAEREAGLLKAEEILKPQIQEPLAQGTPEASSTSK